MSVAAAVNLLLYHLQKEQDASPLTIRNYRHYLKRFIQFCDDHSPSLSTLQDISHKAIDQYQYYLNELTDKNGVALKRITKAYHLIALRTFFRFLTKKGYCRISYRLISLPAMNRQSVTVLHPETVDKLLNKPRLSTPAGLRDRALLTVLTTTGITVTELVSLNRDDVDLKEQMMIVQRRNGRRRQITTPPETLSWINRYLSMRTDHYKPVFIRYAGKRLDRENVDDGIRLSSRSVQRTVEKYAKKSGITAAVTPQILRHSYAVQLLKRGADSRSLQKFLGYESALSIKQYDHFARKP